MAWVTVALSSSRYSGNRCIDPSPRSPPRSSAVFLRPPAVLPRRRP
jgi:hypothetical protein